MGSFAFCKKIATLKKYSFFVILFLLLFPFQSLRAQNQIKAFSEDSVKFLDEMETFFETSNESKRDIKHFFDDFSEIWKSGKLGVEYKAAAYKTCNLMLKKRLRPFPDFKSYLSSLMNFVSTNQSKDNFSTWQYCIDKILNGKAIKYYTDYLSMSENLFASNTFYKSPTTEWNSSNKNYIFEFDSIPKVIFPGLNLRCYNNQLDSAVIYNTKGVYYPSLGKFVGSAGKVNWLRTGIAENVVYAELKNYQVILKSGGYSADSVSFYNKSYFSRALKGTLIEKVISEDISVASYPRFESYDKRLQINGLTENVDYDGGFFMRGGKFIGSGSKEQDAYLIFKRNDKPFLIAASKSFSISNEKINSEKTSIKLFLDMDSIYHPGLQLNFMILEKHLLLIRNEEGLAKSPYFNSYHAMDMFFEQFSWKTDQPKIDFKMLLGSTQGEADFESSNYYKEERYNRLQGIDAIHPLIVIKDFVKTNANIKEFYVDELAKYMKLSSNQVRPQLIRLSSLGFISFDIDDDRVYVKDRLYTYVTDRAGKTDYDVLSFNSVTSPGANNASINLLNNDLTIHGVSSILLSDSQNVYIYPSEKKVVVKKDRNFSFGGNVHAGRFDYFGKEFSFEYDKFKINLTNVDSLRLMVESETPDSYGKRPLVRVKTVIEHINGDLLIDNPANKSGVKRFPQYPIFNSSKDSYVYYSKRSIQKGTYLKDKFYFHLEPFTIDSLDNFNNKALTFKGDFVSADIFPQFKESLTLQHDYSLGFIRSTPPDGFALYGGKGKYFSEIKMSHEGLRGDGTINYITSTTKSKDFIFYPDSMNTRAQNFDIKEQKAKVEFPQVNAEEVYIHWRPYKDNMKVHKLEKVMSCYNKQAEFNGRLDLTPSILTGKGIVNFVNAELESKLIKFAQIKFDADTADFRMKAGEDISNLSFSTNNVNAHVDFASRTGEFKANGRGSIVKFPVNQYFCFMDKFKWYMDKSVVELGADKKNQASSDVDLSGSEFISTHAKQDSLRFIAPFASYDLKNYIISAKNVKYINVADARIFPDSGNVVVKKNAIMETLSNAEILANTTTKYHKVYNGVVTIFGRKSYEGSGYYDYIDEIKNKQSIYFNNISVDTTYQTYAESTIADSANFTLSPNFDFKGKVKFTANNQFLNFNGFCKITHDCKEIGINWLNFSSDINPLQIYIPVSAEPMDIHNDKLEASIVVTNDSTHLYSSFLSKKIAKSDLEVLPADGFLFFDKSSREYCISNKEKLVERSQTGNYLSLNTTKCLVYGEGKLNFSSDLGQVKMEAVGNARHFLIPDSTSFDLMMNMDFFFDDNAIEKMAIAITNTAGLTSVDYSRPLYEKGLRELVGKDKADKFIAQINLYGSYKKIPDELKHTFFLSDVKMKWNKETRSFTSIGEIGIGNINKFQINKFINGNIEIIKKKSGDIVNIYLELESGNWYYFNYTRGLMQAISSNEVFNTIIKELKSEKREMKTQKGEASYEFNLSIIKKKSDFLKRLVANE